MSEPRQHPADLPILAFIEDHLEHGTLFVLRADVHPLGMHLPFGQGDATANFVEQFLGRHARHLHEIFLFHSIPRMGEEVGQRPVVGDEDQPFAHAVEPADGKQSLLTRHEVDHAGSAVGIVVGGHHAHRLVEHVDDPLRVGQFLAIYPYLGLERIDPRAEQCDDLPVDFDATGRDQFLAGSPTAEASRSEHLLEPLQTVIECLEPTFGGTAGIVFVGEWLPLRRPTRRDPRGFCAGRPRGAGRTRGTGRLGGAWRAWGAVCRHGGNVRRKSRGLMRRATIAAGAPIIHPQMLRGAWTKVRGKTQRLTMPPAARERLLLWRPPAGPPHLRHRGCEVARPCAVHQRHAEARGCDVVLQVGIKPHGPSSLESLGARVEPVGLAQGGAAGRCRQGQGQNWQQQGTAHAHGEPAGAWGCRRAGV